MTESLNEPRLFTMPIHPVDKELAAVAARGSRGVHPGRRARLHRSYVGEHHTDRAENITSCAMFICTLVDADQAHQARHRHDQHAEQPSGRGRANMAMLDHLLDGVSSSASRPAA